MGLNVLKKNNKKNNNLRNFTNYFKQKICKYREILYYENAPYENNHFIYFIQNGEFETYGNKSLQEIDQILLNSNYKNKLNKIEMDELGNVKEYYYKKQLKFECFGENDVIGLSDCIYNNHYLFTVSCKTNNAIVYEININFFKVFFNNNPQIQENFEKMQRIKNNIFLNTLYKQRLSEVQYIYVKYKDNPVFYFNLSHGINSYNKTKYAEKKFILQIKRPLSQYNLEKKQKKDKDSFMETSLIKNKIQSSAKKHNSSKFSRRKYSYNIDLIIRDEETANSSKHHHLNTFSMNTESNFIFEPKKRLNTQNKKQINLFKSRNLYLKSIKKNVLKNNKIIKLNYLSVDNSKNDLNNKINSNTNSNNNTFTNPLAYDDFDRKYNSFRYFKPKKEDLNDNLYRLEISSAMPIKKKKKRFLSMI
jgi:CRP-like cAMP-binding protein